jgi:hypothetical protein
MVTGILLSNEKQLKRLTFLMLSKNPLEVNPIRIIEINSPAASVRIVPV